MKRESYSIAYTIAAEALEGEQSGEYEAKYLLKNCYRKLGEAYAEQYADKRVYYVFLNPHGDYLEFKTKEEGEIDPRLHFVEKRVILTLK